MLARPGLQGDWGASTPHLGSTRPCPTRGAHPTAGAEAESRPWGILAPRGGDAARLSTPRELKCPSGHPRMCCWGRSLLRDEGRGQAAGFYPCDATRRLLSPSCPRFRALFQCFVVGEGSACCTRRWPQG